MQFQQEWSRNHALITSSKLGCVRPTFCLICWHKNNNYPRTRGPGAIEKRPMEPYWVLVTGSYRNREGLDAGLAWTVQNQDKQEGKQKIKEVKVMRGAKEMENCETCTCTTGPCSTNDEGHRTEDYVWSTSEQARHRAFSLWIIRSIVEKHGGTVDIDLATDTLNIDVPEEEQAACALELERQVGSMCC